MLTVMNKTTPIWITALLAVLSGSGGAISTGTYANFQWMQNNEPRFENLDRRLTIIEDSIQELSIELTTKVSTTTRLEMAKNFENTIQEIREDINTLQQQHMLSGPGWPSIP